MQPDLEMTETDWERIFQKVLRKYRAARRNQPAVRFFSWGSSRYDGHVLVAGKDVEPLYIIVIVLGPLVAGSLADFFVSKAPGFVEITCWGDAHTKLPWSAVGALPAAEALSKQEHKMMVSLIGAMVQELIERSQGQQLNN